LIKSQQDICINIYKLLMRLVHYEDCWGSYLSSVELVLGGVGGLEGKNARASRKMKTAGTAITYR
jgi:hypothetical protein